MRPGWFTGDPGPGARRTPSSLAEGRPGSRPQVGSPQGSRGSCCPVRESAARAEPDAGQPHRRLTDTVPANQGEAARRPDQWAACLTGVGRAGGQAGEKPAPARGAAWPGAAGKTGREGRGAAGKAAGPAPRGPAVTISARPGSAARGAGDDAWDREGRAEAREPLCSALPQQPRRPPSVGTAPALAPAALAHGLSLAGRRFKVRDRRRVRDGFGGLATAPRARPDSRGRKGPCSSPARPPGSGCGPPGPPTPGRPE